MYLNNQMERLMGANCEKPKGRTKAQDAQYSVCSPLLRKYARTRPVGSFGGSCHENKLVLSQPVTPSRDPSGDCHWQWDSRGLCRAQNQAGHCHLLCLIFVIPRPLGPAEPALMKTQHANATLGFLHATFFSFSDCLKHCAHLPYPGHILQNHKIYFY